MFFIRMRSRTPLKAGVAHLGQRHAEVGDVRPLQLVVERPRRVVEQPAAGADFGDVLLVGRGVERHHQVEVRRARGVAVLADPDLVPGRQALDVRREDVLAGDRHAHAEDGLHDQAVGRRRPGAVGRGDLEREVVDAVIDLRRCGTIIVPRAQLRQPSRALVVARHRRRHDGSACGISTANLRMSHA